MTVINYKLRDDIKHLIICLYNPSGSSEETRYTFASLWDYILDCGWQLEQGERIKRYPYSIAPCLADAEREQLKFKVAMSALRKEKSANNTSINDNIIDHSVDDNVTNNTNHHTTNTVINTAVNVVNRAARTADHAFIRKSMPHGDISTAHGCKVTSPSNRQKEKRFSHDKKHR